MVSAETLHSLAALVEAGADPHVAEAKRLLRQHLRNHPDEGVRAVNLLAEPADDHPAVVKIAAALRARSGATRMTDPATIAAREDCGYCYGNGCFTCGNRGWVETAAGREAREEWEDGAYDRDRDDRMMDRYNGR